MRAGGILRWVECVLFQAWGPKFISAEPTSNQEVQAWNPSPCRRMSNGDRRDPEGKLIGQLVDLTQKPTRNSLQTQKGRQTPKAEVWLPLAGCAMYIPTWILTLHFRSSIHVLWPYSSFFLFAPPPLAPPPPPLPPPHPLLPSFLSSSDAHLLHIHWCKHRCAFPSDNYKWWNGMCNIAHLGLWMRLRLIKHPGNIYQTFASYFWE